MVPLWIVISILMFLLGISGEDGSFGKGLLFGLFWPLALVYLIISLFWGAGKWL